MSNQNDQEQKRQVGRKSDPLSKVHPSLGYFDTYSGSENEGKGSLPVFEFNCVENSNLTIEQRQSLTREKVQRVI